MKIHKTDRDVDGEKMNQSDSGIFHYSVVGESDLKNWESMRYGSMREYTAIADMG